MGTNASTIFAGGGAFLGTKGFKPLAGKYFHPPHLVLGDSGATTATTAARIYFVPWILEHATTYAGAWCYNSGGGDSGDKIKIAMYNEAASGGPGTLAKSFGEVTLTAAGAVRNFASSWSASPGRYYLALITDNAVSMQAMFGTCYLSAVGIVVPNMVANTLGQFGVTLNATSPAIHQMSGDYAAGTYANFPEATALTPTGTTLSENASSVLPMFGLYT